MLTWLRIVVSCFCLVLCMLFAGLWVRGYYYKDTISQPMRPDSSYLMSKDHAILVLVYVPRRQMNTYEAEKWQWFHARLKSTAAPLARGFYWKYIYDEDRFDLFAHAPHWFFVLITGFAALLAKPKPRWQFGMRELFVLSTIGAITVGTLAVVLRAINS